MINILEDIMMSLFVIADLIWLLRIWRTSEQFSKGEKCRAISFTMAFLLAFFSFIIGQNIIGSIICLLGYVISEFTIAVTFYENYKDKEMPYE